MTERNHEMEPEMYDPFLAGNERLEKCILVFYHSEQRADPRKVLYCLYQRMMENGHFLIPTIGDIASEEGCTFPFMEWRAPDGTVRRYMPVFTNRAELEKGESEEKHGILSFFMDTYLENVLNFSDASGVVINLFGCSFTMENEVIRILTEAVHGGRGKNGT